MTQTLDKLPADYAGLILCCYINQTHNIEIARITNTSDWRFERVSFPGERLLFEAPLEAQLEIYTTRFSTVVLEETIACANLVIESSHDVQQDCYINLAAI